MVEYAAFVLCHASPNTKDGMLPHSILLLLTERVFALLKCYDWVALFCPVPNTGRDDPALTRPQMWLERKRKTRENPLYLRAFLNFCFIPSPPGVRAPAAVAPGFPCARGSRRRQRCPAAGRC